MSLPTRPVRPDGGAPQTAWDAYDAAYLAWRDAVEEQKLRDSFARAALTGLLANPGTGAKSGDVGDLSRLGAVVSRTVYRIADDMLAARKEQL